MSDATHSIEEVKKHVRVYIMVFAALAVLTVVTVAVAYLDLSIWPALILALLIASVKGSLVGAYFMHLAGEKKIILATLLLTAAFFIAMVVIFVAAYHGQDGGYLTEPVTNH